VRSPEDYVTANKEDQRAVIRPRAATKAYGTVPDRQIETSVVLTTIWDSEG
jgi:hypothetical protein